MEHEGSKIRGLPENAYTPLKKGEEYIPYIPAGKTIPEVTLRSVLIGVFMAILFSFSACYLGLVAGQVFEAAIPIAILAVGIAGLYSRKSTILENVIIQSIGSASGAVVAGAIFTLPALYILGLKVSLLHTFIACTLGGFLGILFLIPIRRYFCREQHGQLPFPEATATTEILATGESGGKSARVLVFSMILGGIYDFLVEAMHVWPKTIKTDLLLGKAGAFLEERARWVFKLNSSAAIFGLGYIVGIKYASIIAAGSVLSFLILLPVIFSICGSIAAHIPFGEIAVSGMTEVDVFKTFVQKIGIGAIAMAGFIGIAKMGKIIVTSFSIGMREIFRGKHAGAASIPRTDRDMKIKNTLFFIIGSLILIYLAFLWIASPAEGVSVLTVALIGLAIVVILAFLFTPVAARAIAIVGVNPVSGMTLITLIITSLVLVGVGLKGTVGMTTALIIGCVVCTALSTSGAFITDLKVGYWLGATPRNQQRWKFLGVVVSAISVSLALMLIHKAYGFTLPGGGSNPAIPAPQGNLMATIIKSLMVESNIPYLLYVLGALIAILLQIVKIPPLAFALGMYLPIEINMPLLAGGIVSWMVIRTSKKMGSKASLSPKERGTLIASGFIAGGALMGVVGALLNLNDIGKPIRFISVGARYVFEKGLWLIPEEGGHLHYFETLPGQLISLAGFIGLCVFCYYYARGRKK